MQRMYRSFALPAVEPFKVQLLHWAEQNKIFFWLNSHFHKDRYSGFESVLALGVASCLQSDKAKNAFEKLHHFQQKQKDFLFGFLSYDLKNDIETLHSHHRDGLCFPKLFFFVPEKIIFIKKNRVVFQYLKDVEKDIEKDFEQIRNYTLPVKPVPQKKIHLKNRISKRQYLEKVNTLQKNIQKGNVYEVNFCQEFYEEEKKINPLQTFLQLDKISLAPFSAMVKLHKKYALCASPERFLKKQNQTIISQPIKGTAQRIPHCKERDTALKNKLLYCKKERSENTMIVDLVRNDLSKIAQKSSVKVTEFCKIYSFEQVHQMISTITCKTSKNPVEIIKNAFPMGSMTGAPKIAAMQCIENLETTQRGLYSGSIGYFTPKGNFDFNVVIRTLLYNAQNQYLSHMVGSAITAQSKPEKEYEECLLKAKAVQYVLENTKDD